MRCPVDDSDLVMSERQGIEIDYCAKCRGVWLDRGELDKIIERAGSTSASPSRSEESYNRQPRRYEEHEDDDRDDDDRRNHYRGNEHGDYDNHHNDHHGKKRKKEGFLGDLFDF